MPSPEGGAEASPSSPTPPPDDAFRRKAHATALSRVRTAILPVLRRLDPVAAAQVEGTPLRPPGLDVASRASLRTELEPADDEANGIDEAWLDPLDAVVLRAMQTTLARGHLYLRRPWRDDPRAVLFALEPYLEELGRRIPAGECDADGCGLDQLGPMLRAGFEQVGSASLPTVSAAREDLAALAAQLDRWGAGRPAEHPVAAALPSLRAVIEELDAGLEAAAIALPTAEELPWSSVVPSAEPSAWKRRPARWGAAKLTEWLTHAEAYGHPPKALFDGARTAAARMGAMVEREGGQPDASTALPRPFDLAACRAAFAPFESWVKGQATHLHGELDCEAVIAELGPAAPDDAAIVLRIIDRGIIDPTRAAAVRATAPDITMLRGRMAPAAERTTLQVAITAATGWRGAELRAIEEARHDACLAAVAVWIHGELGPTEELARSLDGLGCGSPEPLVAAAEARPRAALRGLGLLLLGLGPADAAALDRYWWAPAGLVRNLALPPGPAVETPPEVEIQPIEVDPG
ncbi:MAG: hypothetical protein KC501_22635 [Myxococcales bacterium]|nr:hypothetical protein [Myxococcales bacterium]